MDPDKAIEMYKIFLEILNKKYPGKIQSGKFGELMEVSLINDGPVTINWEYPELKSKDNKKDLTKDLNEINEDKKEGF
jgi:hypothetical protein